MTEKAATIMKYLEDHDLQNLMQEALQSVCDSLAPNPMLALSEFFAKKNELATQEAVADATGGAEESTEKARWPLGEIFMQFDTDGDGVLDMGEFTRALKAIGMPKRDGSKKEMDEYTFKRMDTNGDGKLSVQEFESNMPLALRAKLESKLEAGWKFDEAKWAASQERHKTWNMAKVFKMFSEDEETLSKGKLKRAFRAIGLKKRTGEKMEMDDAMFAAFDTNGDNKISLEEFETNMPPAVRAKIVEMLDGGWKFDPAMWSASQTRHKACNFAKLFKTFDMDSDGYLDFREMQRAFRAIGLKKRAGANYELDAMTFKTFDDNGDGKVSLEEFEKNMPDALREKITEIIESGWKFDAEKWAASQERHKDDEGFDPNKAFNNSAPIEVKFPLGEIFMQFDTDGDGVLDSGEFKRALHAIGLEKRTGDKADLDDFTFKQMDKNGDGKLSIEEFDANMPIALRAKLEEKLDGGWKFDEEKWKASQERHSKWNMAKVFAKFDTDGDGILDFEEFKRGFRAIGLKKRSGEEYEIDEEMFKAFDTNGDGHVSLQEFQDNLHDATRKKIEEKLDGGWRFDPELWKASQARHGKANYAKIYKKFDSDSDGVLDARELQRAFRAMGLKKRSGEKFLLDQMVFKSFDTNGDGKVSLEEFEANMPAELREKLDEQLANGWEFDEAAWKASQERHKDDPEFDGGKIY